ncbi:hypothetical protein F2Q69_00015086 [Brassica cretica]|uniref:Uncharacterized protein n=1 Tax=Brassica cretica TaxID=69181 RepID=A0A8S9R0U1_BRACR|nr:hypothetical protein F2Q69_00015086 [Brassica cretica]
MEVKKKGSFTFEIKLKDVMESPTLLQAGIHTTQMARLRFKRSDWTGQTDGQGAAKRMRWRGNRGWRWREDGIWLAGLMSLSSWINGWDGVKNRHKFGDENLIRFKALSRLASHAELERKRVSLLGAN